MKTVIWTLAAALLVGGATVAQGPMPPPKELKAIAFMKGDWTGEFKMYEKGKEVGIAKGPISTADSLGGMYIESKFETDMGGMKMIGLQLTSYDSNKKQYMAYWFDSMAPGVLELRGSLKGQTLIMTSKPTSFPGMPGKNSFRATNAIRGPNQMLFRLELNSGKGWSKLLEGMMVRK